MSDVFISYKAEDRARVRPLVDALQSERLTVWWDEQVGGGEAWRERIAEQLDAASCVIVVWSKRSIGPDGRFVRDEANRAQRRGSYLPVTIDNVEPPLGFGEMQALPLNGWRGKRDDRRYRAVSDCVHSMLGRTPTAPSRPPPASSVSRRTAIAGGAVAVVAAASGAWMLLRPSGAKANTIAVLPFANLSGDPAQAYFSDGIAEEVRGALAASGVQVVARTSSEMLRNADAQTAARRLSVAHVITGSVRRSPSTVRVSAQLVDGESGIERWSQTFDRPFGDVLQIQSDIAANVARALSIRLGRTAASAPGGTKNPQAQDLLLQARATEGDDGSPAMLRRIDLYDRAMQLDPNYAEAHARKAIQQSLWANAWAHDNVEKVRVDEQAMEAARRAIRIAPAMPLGYSALGLIYNNKLMTKRSLEANARAVELPGTDTVALMNYAIVLSRTGRRGEAKSMIGRALSLDPLNSAAQTLRAWILLHARRYNESAEVARLALTMAPANRRARSILALSLIQLGQTDQALRELQAMPEDDYRRIVGEAAIAGHSGQKANALRSLGRLESYGDTVHYQRAQIYAQAGERDKAIAALEAAWSARDSGLNSAPVDPLLDPLRGDPRFNAIVKRLLG